MSNAWLIVSIASLASLCWFVSGWLINFNRARDAAKEEKQRAADSRLVTLSLEGIESHLRANHSEWHVYYPTSVDSYGIMPLRSLDWPMGCGLFITRDLLLSVSMNIIISMVNQHIAEQTERRSASARAHNVMVIDSLAAGMGAQRGSDYIVEQGHHTLFPPEFGLARSEPVKHHPKIPPAAARPLVTPGTRRLLHRKRDTE